ncbi:acyl-CoA N-acyltransferase, partial [Backusella circina FSU 941]
FNPEFTYPIFGDHETVFGYKDLALTISFASGSLRAFVQVNHTEQYEDTLDIKKDDILNTLNEFLPKDNPKTKAEFVDTVYKDFETFKPIGEKIKEYEKGDSLFEIYKCDFTNDKFKEYYQRMQVFALFFIEGSSYIDVDDEKWEIYTVFQFKKETDSYDFIGYCNAYPFYCWPENIRMRISQFLILPPYKQRGHGSKLYSTLYELFKGRPEICELTVEDPNEDFSDMRDKNDTRYLRSHGALQELKAPVSTDTINGLCEKYKLTNRQLQRCMEMDLLSKLNVFNEKDYQAYRLQVKQRLYSFNFDVLREMSQDERREKLQETYLGVEDDYHRLLELL